MTLDDLPAALALSRASGWNQREEDWRLLLTLNPGRFVAAILDGRVIGTGGAACYGRTLAWVCMILVDKAQRGRGLGTRLVESVLARLGDVAAIGLDATPGGRPVYARLGFEDGGRLVRMGGIATGTIEPRAAPISSGDFADVLRLDRDVFGADRTDALRFAFEQAPALAVCVKDAGAIAGYCFGRPGNQAAHVGPVAARNPEAGRALISTALATVAGLPVILDVPAEHEGWLTFLAELGLREQRPFTRMYRNGVAPHGRPDLQLAIFGPELG